MLRADADRAAAALDDAELISCQTFAADVGADLPLGFAKADNFLRYELTRSLLPVHALWLAVAFTLPLVSLLRPVTTRPARPRHYPPSGEERHTYSHPSRPPLPHRSRGGTTDNAAVLSKPAAGCTRTSSRGWSARSSRARVTTPHAEFTCS